MLALRVRAPAVIAVLTIGAALSAHASPNCPEEQPQAQAVDPRGACKMLTGIVEHPGVAAHDLRGYELHLSEFMQDLCYRDSRNGWRVDKRIRDTGPWIATLSGGKWSGQYFGTHAPVLIWYSPKMIQWLKVNRPEPTKPAPVPDGAIMIKEMYSKPASACGGISFDHLLPTESGAALMVRDSKASRDGWFWGWYGWNGWSPDWPANPSSPPLNMSFGLSGCTNCHASAKDNDTFAALANIRGEPGKPLVFLSQHFFMNSSGQSEHGTLLAPSAPPAAMSFAASRGLPGFGLPLVAKVEPPAPPYDPVFTHTFWWPGGPPKRSEIVAMPPSTYDNVWVKAGKVTAASQFLTSSQCIGCHDAGSTGIQFDMTEPGPGDLMVNISPYSTWRTSPMGLAGRDPVFFAQLASETEKFHPAKSRFIQDTCLGCHGILGQRQFGIDQPKQNNQCAEFSRDDVSAVPYPSGNPPAANATYGALARDGISCTACHHMALGDAESKKVAGERQNKCVVQRQEALNPGLKGFAKTFTGSFLVGPPDQLIGPFENPKTKSMANYMGIDPVHSQNVLSSELCGSCHTVHLPVLHDGKPVADIYEQTTYPEWAFSAYRTGVTPDGNLPLGAGSLAQSCQACHMPNKTATNEPFRSKIASIQEYNNFPEAENTLKPDDIDLPVRAGFAKHTLVGLNLFLLKMDGQFPDLFGIPTQDPMLTSKGVDPIPVSESAMIDQATTRTAVVRVGDPKLDAKDLSAKVTVTNLAGHKLPSGVGFRRIFIEFDVLDANNNVLWASGHTNGAGVIVDQNRNPIRGELWWDKDCKARIDPEAQIHQRHYETITRQDEAQIYQELVAAPPPGSTAPKCGAAAQPQDPKGPLTTSFLSICTKVKDNRILPEGFLDRADREKISVALGAGKFLAEETDPVSVHNDPDYSNGGGSDSLVYRVPLAALKGAKPASVRATLYSQATPPFFLQDRFCTSHSSDTARLYYAAGKLRLGGSQAQGWAFKLATSGAVPVQ